MHYKPKEIAVAPSKPYKIKGYAKMGQADKVRSILKLTPDELQDFLKTGYNNKAKNSGVKWLDNHVFWHVFAIFIKLRDTDEKGSGRCFTCGKWQWWHSTHSGHGVERDKFCTKYDEKNNHIQCANCNYRQHFHDVKNDYIANVDSIYGAGTFAEMVINSKGKCFKKNWYFYEQIPLYITRIKCLPNYKLIMSQR